MFKYLATRSIAMPARSKSEKTLSPSIVDLYSKERDLPHRVFLCSAPPLQSAACNVSSSVQAKIPKTLEFARISSGVPNHRHKIEGNDLGRHGRDPDGDRDDVGPEANHGGGNAEFLRAASVEEGKLEPLNEEEEWISEESQVCLHLHKANKTTRV